MDPEIGGTGPLDFEIGPGAGSGPVGGLPLPLRVFTHESAHPGTCQPESYRRRLPENMIPGHQGYALPGRETIVESIC